MFFYCERYNQKRKKGNKKQESKTLDKKKKGKKMKTRTKKWVGYLFLHMVSDKRSRSIFAQQEKKRNKAATGLLHAGYRTATNPPSLDSRAIAAIGSNNLKGSSQADGQLVVAMDMDFAARATYSRSVPMVPSSCPVVMKKKLFQTKIEPLVEWC